MPEVGRERRRKRERERAERKRPEDDNEEGSEKKRKKAYWLQSVFKVLSQSLSQKEKSEVARQRVCQK